MADDGFLIVSNGKTLVEQGHRVLGSDRHMYCWIASSDGAGNETPTRSALIVRLNHRRTPEELWFFDPSSPLHHASFEDSRARILLRDGSQHVVQLEAAPDLVLNHNILLQLSTYCAGLDRRQDRHLAHFFSPEDYTTHQIVLEPCAEHDWGVSNSLLLKCDERRSLLSAETAGGECIGYAGTPVVFDEPLDRLRAAPGEPAAAAEKLSAASWREVVIPGDDVMLHGLFACPRHASPPYAACIFLNGSGPVTRWSVARGIRLKTLDTMAALAKAGVASLAFDARGAGQTGFGDIRRTLLETRLADAVAATRWLAAAPAIDPKRITGIGHSLGALVLLQMLGLRDAPALANIVLLAPAGRPLREILMQQNKAEGLRAGLSPEAMAEQAAAFQAFLKASEAPGFHGPRLIGPHAIASPDLLDAEPLAMLRNISQPLLVLQGGKDFQISPALDAAPLVARARSEGHACEYCLIPDADHLFRLEPETSTPERYKTDLPVHPDYLIRLVRWVTSHDQHSQS